MNQALAYFCLALFAALPPALLVARFRRGQAFPWVAIFAVIVVGGWVLVNLANYFYGHYLCEPVIGVSNPPEEALARCTTDGARNAFAFFLGWLYGLIYSIPFFGLFSIATWLRRRRALVGKHAV